MKKISSTNPRRWGIEDLENDRGGYRRALPVIVLNKWEREGGAPGADCLTLEEVSNELVASGAITEPMSGRALGAWMGAFVRKQNERNLTPIFLEQIDPGVWRFNVKDYESLLRKFRELYPLTGKSEEARRMELPLKELHRWTVEDLESRKQLMRALPVIALEKWESEDGAPGADHLTIKEINKELLARGVISKPISGTGVGALVYGLVQRQEKRKLNPLLVERVERGVWRFNIGYYETVLREFRDRYPLRRTGTISSQPRQQEPAQEQVDAHSQRTGNVSNARTVEYVDPSRMNELRGINSEWDLARLIKMCEELNACYAGGHYLAVSMLTRSIIDHVPPILGCKTFADVVSSYGGAGRSFRETMELLDKSRKIADANLHLQIRHKEVLPNQTQIDFRSALDMLLGEIVRVLR